jgi:hypothetical protein
MVDIAKLDATTTARQLKLGQPVAVVTVTVPADQSVSTVLNRSFTPSERSGRAGVFADRRAIPTALG